MDKNTARQLIKETFQNPFSKDSFVYFVKNLLNYIEEAPFIYRGNFIPDAFDSYIKTLERIGKYQDPEDKQIDVLIVRLKKESSLEHAGTMQRNFIAWYLNGSRGGKLKDAALVAFVAPNGKDWRFSLVKMEYKLAKTQTGRVRAKEELTPARRYSFLVGIHESSHTAQSRLVPILEDDVNNPTLKRLEESFNIEKVTKEFFEKYRDLYLKVKETLDALIKEDSKIKNDFKQKNVSAVDFAKKLLGQIVFLYFLQKKGWFGVKCREKWGTGSKNFLRELFNKEHGGYKNFFNDILEPLFYEALRQDRSYDDDYYSRFDCRIPFLNGGLFDPLNNYDWVNTDIFLPNELFSNRVKTKKGDVGTGILDIFDRYNFTVKEDEPLEKEVAVDPEMLGKVFENLLEVKDRKSKGTYYTPREIVHYMCRESLINYLEAETSIDKEKLNLLVHFDQFMAQKMPKTKRLKAVAMWEGEVKEIEESLEKIRIVDPACGSGAFLVGMMQEIIGLKKILSLFFKTNNLSNYQLKLKSIQNNLYGVDIDPGAAEIAKLRLWLSLVVDEEDIKQIKPLPNLDYKIVCGNSLLGVEKGGLFVSHWMQELEKIKNLLFAENNPNKKQEYQKQINELIKQITNGHKEFDFEIYFSEVFKEKGGFDITIANPPYIRIQKLSHKDIDYFKKRFKFAYKRLDISLLFFEKGLEILNPNGNLAFISSNQFLVAAYGEKARLGLLKHGIRKIIDFESLPIFDNAITYTSIFIINKKKKSEFFEFSKADSLLDFAEQKLKFEKIYTNDLGKEYWTLGDNTNIKLLNKIKDKCILLKNLAKTHYGIISGRDDVFVINEEKVKAEKIEKDYIRKIILPENIKRWKLNEVNQYIIYPYRRMDKTTIENESLLKKEAPHLYQYLKKHQNELENRKDSRRTFKKRKDWYGLVRFSSINIFDQSKIISPTIVKTNKFAIDNNGFAFAGGKTAVLTSENINIKFLLGILNSKLAEFYYHKITPVKAGGYRNYSATFILELPIKRVSLIKQKPFIKIVDKILTITQADDYLENSTKQAKVHEYEKQIDQMVYKLYGLTKEEIKIVEEQAIK